MSLFIRMLTQHAGRYTHIGSVRLKGDLVTYKVLVHSECPFQCIRMFYIEGMMGAVVPAVLKGKVQPSGCGTFDLTNHWIIPGSIKNLYRVPLGNIAIIPYGTIFFVFYKFFGTLFCQYGLTAHDLGIPVLS